MKLNGLFSPPRQSEVRSAESRRPIMERHRQETFFDVNDQPTQNWCWIVEQKFSREMLDAMGRDPTIPAAWEIGKCPSHFRTEARAIERAEGLAQECVYGIKQGLVEFRVVPKYIGYVPAKDESWII